MASRSIEVSKKALDSACRKLLSDAAERTADFERRLTETKEEYCLKAMEQRFFGFFGPKTTKAQAERSWEIAWENAQLEDNENKIFSLILKNFKGYKIIQDLKREQVLSENDQSEAIAWRLHKMAIATHGPIVRIPQDEFQVLAPFIETES